MHRFLFIGAVSYFIAWTVQAQSANDHFTNRFLLTGASILTNGSNLGATSEPGELPCTRSTWWQWTAPTNGIVLISVKGNLFSRPSAYVGERLLNLQEVAPLPPTWSALALPVITGNAYQIAVQSDLDNGGDYQLHLDFFEPPSNDNFANRIHLESGSAEAVGHTVGASTEPGETWTDSPSLWWSWTARTSGPVTIHLTGSMLFYLDCGMAAHLGMGVFTGESMTELVPVPASYQGVNGILDTTYCRQVAFNATAGTTYQIQTFSLCMFALLTVKIAPTQPPLVMLMQPIAGSEYTSQSNIEAAAGVYDLDGRITQVDFYLASLGDYDPNHQYYSHLKTVGQWPFTLDWTNLYPGGYELIAVATDDLGVQGFSFPVQVTVNPIWRTWTTPTSGVFTVTGVSAVYTGDSISNLALVPNLQPEVSPAQMCFVLWAEAGVIYYFAPASEFQILPSALPTVTITSPTNQAHTIIGSTAIFSAEAASWDGSTVRVDFYRNSKRIGSVTNPPYAIALTLTNQCDLGWYEYWAQVTDNNGLSTWSQHVYVTVEVPPVPPPPNDNFADAFLLTGSTFTVTGTCTSATREPGESDPSASGTVWWSWTCPFSGSFTLSANSWPRMNVYTGSSISNLVLAARNDSADPGRLILHATSGTAYYFQISGGEQFTLTLVPSAPPTITLLSPTNWQAVTWGSNVILQAAVSDPEGVVTRVEFIFSGRLIGTATEPPFTLLFTPSQDDAGYRDLAAKVTDDYGLTTTSPSVSINVVPPPPGNDDFANRFFITGASLTITGTTASATLEPGEPDFGRTRSVWWSWTASASGTVTLTEGPYSGHAVAVYTGGAISNLELVATNQFIAWEQPWYPASRTIFSAVAGRTYHIAAIADSWGGPVSVTIVQSAPPEVSIAFPTNDASVLSAQPVTLSASATDADGTIQRVDFFLDWQWVGAATNPPFQFSYTPRYWSSGQHYVWAKATDNSGLATYSDAVWYNEIYPTPANEDFTQRYLVSGFLILTNGLRGPQPGIAWWSWRAPASGTVTLHGEGGGFNVYTGSNAAGLTLVVTNPSPEFPPFSSAPSNVRFEALAGVTYHFAIENYQDYRWGLVLDSAQAGQISQPAPLSGGAFSLRFTTLAEQTWLLQGSTNLVDWTSVQTNTSRNHLFEFMDSEANGFSQRFYRVVSPP